VIPKGRMYVNCSSFKSFYGIFSARLHQNLGEFAQAESYFRKLIRMNQENEAYYHGLARALQIDKSPKEMVKMYEEITEQYPRAYMPKRLILCVTTGEEMLTYLRPFLVNHFEKGTPSVFTDLKHLYKEPEKASAIEKLVESMAACLEKTQKFFDGKL